MFSWHVWWRGIGPVAFFIDFQWNRRRVWLNGTNSIRRHICWRLNSSHVLPPGHQISLQSHMFNDVVLNPRTCLLTRLRASSHVCYLHRTSNTVRYNCTQLTGMLGTVALDQQARLFKLQQASVHVCSICTRPPAQPSLPQGQQTQLPFCMFDSVAQGHAAHTCMSETKQFVSVTASQD